MRLVDCLYTANPKKKRPVWVDARLAVAESGGEARLEEARPAGVFFRIADFSLSQQDVRGLEARGWLGGCATETDALTISVGPPAHQRFLLMVESRACEDSLSFYDLGDVLLQPAVHPPPPHLLRASPHPPQTPPAAPARAPEEAPEPLSQHAEPRAHLAEPHAQHGPSTFADAAAEARRAKRARERDGAEAPPPPVQFERGDATLRRLEGSGTLRPAGLVPDALRTEAAEGNADELERAHVAEVLALARSAVGNDPDLRMTDDEMLRLAIQLEVAKAPLLPPADRARPRERPCLERPRDHF
ncbi:hypothetical protein M885DRAFT_524501 [Pelagophyceae sp. CCMP2097]|nr:hypothetical protein M885DRAFT_524501 [Pelagophyceae sp. CCMP2097]